MEGNLVEVGETGNHLEEVAGEQEVPTAFVQWTGLQSTNAGCSDPIA